MRVSELFKMAKIICNENAGNRIDCPINEWCTDGIFSEGEEAGQQLETVVLKNVKKS